MTSKHKDNFTDAIEAFQRQESTLIPEKPKEGQYQVTDNTGEIVTLGQNGKNSNPLSSKRKPVELTQEDLQSIEKSIGNAFDKMFERFLKKFKNKTLLNHE